MREHDCHMNLNKWLLITVCYLELGDGVGWVEAARIKEWLCSLFVCALILCISNFFHIMSPETRTSLQVPSLSELKIMKDTEQRIQIVVTLAFFKVPTQLFSLSIVLHLDKIFLKGERKIKSYLEVTISKHVGKHANVLISKSTGFPSHYFFSHLNCLSLWKEAFTFERSYSDVKISKKAIPSLGIEWKYRIFQL